MMRLIESHFRLPNDHDRFSIAPRDSLDGDSSLLEVVMLLTLLCCVQNPVKTPTRYSEVHRENNDKIYAEHTGCD